MTYIAKPFKFDFPEEVFVREGSSTNIEITRVPGYNISDWTYLDFRIKGRTAKSAADSGYDVDFLIDKKLARGWGSEDTLEYRVEAIENKPTTVIPLKAVWDNVTEGTEYVDLEFYRRHYWEGKLGLDTDYQYEYFGPQTTRVWIVEDEEPTPPAERLLEPESEPESEPLTVTDGDSIIININGDGNVVTIGDNNTVNTLITDMNGRDRLTGTDEEDIFTIQGDGRDKIINFDPTQDTLELDSDLMGGISNDNVKVADSRKDLRLFLQNGSELIYFEPKSKLFLDANGSDRGMGRDEGGGLIAKVDDLDPAAVEVV